MDFTLPELQFLDLTDADEEECDFLQATLFRWNPDSKYPELPWTTQADFSSTPTEWRSTPCAQEESVDGPSALTAVLDEDESDSMAPADAAHVSQDPKILAGPTNTVFPDAPILSAPTSVPGPVPPSVMTTVYHHQIMPGLPISNVYVGNVTANVNVHGYVGTYPHISPQQVYSAESANPPVRNGGREARRSRYGKLGNKQMDGQYGERNSSGRHSQEVIQVQPSPLVESPPANSNMPQQGFPQFYHMSALAHPYQSPYYSPSTPTHLPQPSAQHATGTPIYLSGHPIYPPPPPPPQPLYGPYAPPHQPPGAPPVMSFTAMQPARVPATETPVLGSYQVEGSEAEDRLPAQTGNKDELGDGNLHEQQLPPSSLCATSYELQTLPELCSPEAVTCGHSSKKPVSYQQQQSEEEDFNQANLVNTVVVNNSNIVTEPPPFSETKQSDLVDAVNINFHQSTGHHSFVKNDLQPKFVSDKVSAQDSFIDGHVSLKQASRINISESSANGNAVVSDFDLKRDKAVINGINLFPAVEKCKITDVKSPLSRVDIPTSSVTSVTTPKAAFGLAAEYHTSGQNATADTPVATPGEKSWASLFYSSTVLHCSTVAAPSGNKPLACVKPFQNKVPVTPDASCSVLEGCSVPESASPAVSPGVSNAVGNSVNSLPQLPSPSPADDPHIHQLGEILLKYKLEHKALSLQPRGLTNRSNWCYINSTLQALLACPPFYNLMKALSLPQKRSGKSTTPIIDSMIQFVNEFIPLSATSRLRDRKEKALRKDDGSIEVQCGAPFEPSYIYKMLNCIRSDTFKVEGRQEDAEEFLGCLLNALNDEMLELIKLVEEPSVKSPLINGDIATNGDASAQSQDEDDTEWKVMGPKNKGSVTRRADFGRTPISDIFRGHLRSRVQRAGDQSTDNVQPFFTLQLDVEKAQSVKDALEILVGRDQLEGVTCSRTNQEIEAWQQVTLEELPLVLLLHLKWFDYKLEGTSKIVKCVEFPIDLKVDPKLMSSNKKYTVKQRQYKLFAVVYHDGKEASKGHYITDVFHVGYGGWVRYDDSVVKAVQESSVLHPRVPRVPYLLYYRRCDTIGSQPASDKTR